ncbi:MAG: flap endonuclease, partial [Nannocystaceae bacterium]|nr:flap endonuclease [Nannocystaceae bacterium]
MRLHLIDGTFELYRAHFSPRPGRVDGQGRDVKGTVGLLFSLIALLVDREEDCTHLAVAFDNPIRSFRNDLFAGYKSDEGVLPEIQGQFDLVEEATAALGVTVWSMDEWEADDGLASGAARFVEEVDQVRIMTPDKDLGQCLTDPRVVQVDRMRGKLIDAAAVKTRRGVEPASIPDWLALVG